jgi:signal transduction histidine kinase
VDFRLSNELQPIIDSAIGEERSEMVAQAESLATYRGGMLLAAGLAGVILLLAVAGLALLVGRQARRDLQTATDEGEVVRARLAADLEGMENSRGQLLADIGHQLRTPLTVLRGEADVALRAAPEIETLRAAMQRVRAQAAELALLFDDLIDAARHDSDAQPLAMKPLRLEDLAAVVAEEGRVLAEAREVSIVTETASGSTELQGDFRLLKQALMIGIDNAVKHSPPGGTIGLGASVEGARAMLRVTDGGPGVAAEDQPYLFQRFYRGRAEGDLLNTGFGIGLAIAKNIVERHGGEVALRNRPEGGAMFEIALPLDRRST